MNGVVVGGGVLGRIESGIVYTENNCDLELTTEWLK